MKNVFAVILTVLVSGFVCAGEPKATLCKSEAIDGAVALFKLNHKNAGRLTVSTQLVKMSHSEGGSEVWDIEIGEEEIDLLHAPYRMTVNIDGCILTAFEMPTAG